MYICISGLKTPNIKQIQINIPNNIDFYYKSCDFIWHPLTSFKVPTEAECLSALLCIIVVVCMFYVIFMLIYGGKFMVFSIGD